VRFFFYQPVGLFVNRFARAYGDKVNRVSGRYAVDDSQTSDFKAPQPLKLISQRLSCLRIRDNQFKGGLYFFFICGWSCLSSAAVSSAARML
jgi:hypothetical protein